MKLFSFIVDGLIIDQQMAYSSKHAFELSTNKNVTRFTKFIFTTF